MFVYHWFCGPEEGDERYDPVLFGTFSTPEKAIERIEHAVSEHVWYNETFDHGTVDFAKIINTSYDAYDIVPSALDRDPEQSYPQYIPERDRCIALMEASREKMLARHS